MSMNLPPEVIVTALQPISTGISAGVNNLASAVINDLVVALMVLTIIFIGLKMIIGKEPPQFKSILVNIIVSGILIMGLPSLMNTMQDMSLKFYEGTQIGSNKKMEQS